MKLPITNEREHLTDDLLECFCKSISLVDFQRGSYERLCRLYPDIELLEWSDEEQGYTCYDYAYVVLSRDSNWLSSTETRMLYSIDTFLEILFQRGFRFTETPERNDAVLYFLSDGGPGILEHVGIYEGDNKVISKWGDGPIMRHNIAQVPTVYGNRVEFLRR